ncbi:MAG: hypothetical protein KatS3mg111_1580 [Pirellulaceae bacterium]|nr:MAG: hypothetical protein KatS3mg111_1580 [Pirellulaceae bacterium]
MSNILLKGERIGVVRLFTVPRLISLVVCSCLLVAVSLILYNAVKSVVVTTSMAFLCFCPPMISSCGILNPDGMAAIMAMLVSALACRFRSSGRLPDCILLGVACGVALAVKFTLIVFIAMVMICIMVLSRRASTEKYKVVCCGVSVTAVLAISVLNAVYCYKGVGRPLGSLLFQSALVGDGTGIGNRFHGSWVGRLPIPVPEDYLLGIDYLRMEVERKYWSFLNGEWKKGAWPHYYVMTTLYKTPEPTLIAAGLGFVVFVIGCWRRMVSPELFSMVILLAVPAAACFAAVSLQGGFNHHHRYVLMIYPPMFLFAALVAHPLTREVWRRREAGGRRLEEGEEWSEPAGASVAGDGGEQEGTEGTERMGREPQRTRRAQRREKGGNCDVVSGRGREDGEDSRELGAASVAAGGGEQEGMERTEEEGVETQRARRAQRRPRGGIEELSKGWLTGVGGWVRGLHWNEWLAIVLVTLSAASSLRVHPHYTSYFNTLSGGPENGWRLLNHSNIDWGQDMLEVDEWIKEHPQCRPLRFELDYWDFGGELFGLEPLRPPHLPTGASVDLARRMVDHTEWWIISVKTLYNKPGQSGLEYLQQLEPVDRIAYAYHVYRIDPLPEASVEVSE